MTGKLPQPEQADAKIQEIKPDNEAKAYWKYALYASYVQAQILVDNCEIALSREIYEKFSTPCLQALLKQFYPDLTKQENVFANKVLPDTHYSFKHRRVWAKLRRTAYFIQESEEAYRSLLHDELHFYKGIYDLEAQAIESKSDEATQPLDAKVNGTESEQPLIEEAADLATAKPEGDANKETTAHVDLKP